LGRQKTKSIEKITPAYVTGQNAHFALHQIAINQLVRPPECIEVALLMSSKLTSKGESGTVDTAIPLDWLEDFEAAARRPLETRMRYAFIRTYKPVLDDAPYRAFDTMADYRRWCEENLPEWLGYGRF
jgi:hypothetical protein